jgi:hypothetical protein
MRAFQIMLVAGWLLVTAITAWATAELGLAAAAGTFFSDIGHPWRAQFYADLEAHLLLFALWLSWRERTWPKAVTGAAATMLLGALFTYPYLLVAAIRARGDARQLLLGARAA